MAPRRRSLTEHDVVAWADYIRHVAPLAGRVPSFGPVIPETPVPPADSRVAAGPPGVPSAIRAIATSLRAAPPLVVGTQPPGVDSATWQRLRGGRLPVARRLDLHGRTAHLALQALQAFLQGAAADRVRVVEVITGRGSGETGGVIRRELPFWLNGETLRPLVLAVVHPHSGNPGAVRVLLRRPR